MLTTRGCVATLIWSFTLTFVAGARRKRLPSSAYATPGLNATFDYLVVGGGTTGLAMASRLAEHASVAVVEAGGFFEVDNGNKSVVPFYAFTQGFLSVSAEYSRNPLMDWDLLTVPQSGGNGRIIHYAQGRTLGGCSAHNTLAYLRGTKGSHELWSEIVDDDTYRWENFLPYFKKSCTLSPPDWQKRNTPNATFAYDKSAFEKKSGGPIHISWANFVDPSATWLARALQTLGVHLSPLGLNSGSTSGFGAWTTTMINPISAERSSSTEYLKAAIENTEIMVYHHTQALMINFDSSRKATSVRVSTLGLEYTLAATKEIILSAGVFHTPQLLMVSGIGPPSTLQHHSIPILAPLPGVGQSLQDQLSISVTSGLNTPSASSLINNPATYPIVLDQYLTSQSGPLSSAGGYLSFEKLPSPLRATLSNTTLAALAKLPDDYPELEYIVSPFPGPNGTTIGSISATILHPFSRGSVTLSSNSMADPPVIDLGWLTDPADQELMVAAVKRIRQFWNATVLGEVKVGGEIAPGQDVTDDGEILEWARRTCNQIWHASGSCAMGKEGDPMAVVDAQGRVFGVQGLRVVDASVLPFALPTHPTGTLYALAEKVVDDILRGV
ncbi:Glucose-methanol-choline oxidoreductase N-terminal domain-containing protein [Madurella fahalii]|uniref:Glucose-methanol-choline oxidoreductase N-terminal domain-containing protein n=1 Tax=Madurella fahalii TaxID=1157608 RepID=A0ABQ0GJP3_9PEZI